MDEALIRRYIAKRRNESPNCYKDVSDEEMHRRAVYVLERMPPHLVDKLFDPIDPNEGKVLENDGYLREMRKRVQDQYPTNSLSGLRSFRRQAVPLDCRCYRADFCPEHSMLHRLIHRLVSKFVGLVERCLNRTWIFGRHLDSFVRWI